MVFVYLCSISLLYVLTVSLSLEAGHSSSHDLIHQQKVGGNHGAAVDHLPLHSKQINIVSKV